MKKLPGAGFSLAWVTLWRVMLNFHYKIFYSKDHFIVAIVPFMLFFVVLYLPQVYHEGHNGHEEFIQSLTTNNCHWYQIFDQSRIHFVKLSDYVPD